ncbi:ICOS ligand-like [Cyprinus carpio]|uniref:ICOS ligand-like n=1 Tax=Cyprinus carpio TaxID=7962 RepID=A0A9Q9XPU8_CYPCA|nr:ICOS ligand-like [Cyprinus carpio]
MNGVCLLFLGVFSDPVRVKVEGFVGDSAIFSCSIPESEIQGKTEEFSVHLRDDEGKTVCDITGGNSTCKDQDPKYKDRVETFPDEYKKGNFTFKLNGLQKNDARKYNCYITGPSQNHTITELHVEDRAGGRGNHGRLKIDGELQSIVFFLVRFFLAGILNLMFVAVTFCVARMVFRY